MAKIVTSIDPGDQAIKIIVAEERSRGSIPRIIAAIREPSHGFRRGCVTDPDEATESIRTALMVAEKAIGQKIKRAYCALDGAGLASQILEGSTIASRADSEINDYDIGRIIETTEQKIAGLANRNILDTIPLSYKLDGKKISGKPQGMKGSRLEARILFITCLARELDELFDVVENAGVSVAGVLPSPIAASLVTLGKSQKYAGCVLADIGSETTKIAVFEEGIIHSIEVFDIGSQDVTNDIALGLKVSLDDAEKIKREEGHHVFAQKKLSEIIDARLSDIFELVDGHLKKLGRNELLPAGIIITGGGSFIPKIELLASHYLNLPARIASPLFPQNVRAHEEASKDIDRMYIKDPTYSVAYGLAMFGMNPPKDGGGDMTFRNRKFFGGLENIFKHFLP